MPRDKVSIPFGGGLDRFSGTTVAVNGTELDLRNVSLGPGRVELRVGPATGVVAGFGTDVIALHELRKTGTQAVVVYDAPTRVVKLILFDGTTMSNVGTLWTLDVSLAGHLPRVSVADLYDHLFLAHEEQDYAHRGRTKVIDVSASSIADFKVNLDRTAPAETYFRGVDRHLNYLLGWGFGNQADGNRPEILRIGMPGDPLSMTPEHYFIVGARGDPIIGGQTISADGERALYAIGKADQLYRLVGYDRQTFGVLPADMRYGFRTSRALVVVNGTLYAWTVQGPRSSTGGPLADMSLPLDLNGPLPDPSAAITDDLFAWYDPDDQEVVFCTGAWGFVLHLKDGQKRWSYRQYGRVLNAAGSLTPATGTGSLSFVTATIGSPSSSAPGYGPGADQPTVTVPWTLSGSVTTEQVELYGRSEVFGRPGHVVLSQWVKLGTALASSLTVTAKVPYYLTSFDLAIRVVKNGTPGAGFTDTFADNWPAFARATVVSAGTIASFGITGLWERRTPTNHGQPFAYLGPGSSGAPHPELSYTYEQSIDGGSTWQQHADGTYFAPLGGSQHANTDRLLDVQYRLKVNGPSASTSPSSATSHAVLAPGVPVITSISPDTGELLAGRHLHPVFVTPGTHGGPIEVRARHLTDGSWSVSYTVPAGEVDAVVLTDNTSGSGDIFVEAFTHIDDDVSSVVSQTGTGLG